MAEIGQTEHAVIGLHLRGVAKAQDKSGLASPDELWWDAVDRIYMMPCSKGASSPVV